jgi:hypothetical protein
MALRAIPPTDSGRQLSGEDRSRQLMAAAAVHDPYRRFAARLRCNAAREACSDPNLQILGRLLDALVGAREDATESSLTAL